MKSGLRVSVQFLSNDPGAMRLGELLEQAKSARHMSFDSTSTGQHYLAAPMRSNEVWRYAMWRALPDRPLEWVMRIPTARRELGERMLSACR